MRGVAAVAVLVGVVGVSVCGEAAATPVPCGEASCQPLAGTSFSHFLNLDCTGTEFHYPNYHGGDLSPYSWDGNGIGGTAMQTADPLSFKAPTGVCTNRATSGNLPGLMVIYRCPPPQLTCGGSCIPAGGCCADADCQLAHATASCSANACVYTCTAPYRMCNGACIAPGQCCNASECTTPPGCYKLPATCQLNQCAYAYNDGALCDADGTKCTPNDRCTSGTCQADTAHQVSCVAKDCNTAACNPTSGNCDYTPTNGGACGTTGCFSAGTCSAGACSGAPKDCSATSVGACQVPACDGGSGSCVAANAPNGTACSLPDKCLEGVACSGGSCVGSPKVCVPSGPCVSASCDSTTGSCGEIGVPAGTPCVSADTCSLDGTGSCDADGRCVGAGQPDGTPCSMAMSCAGGASSCNGGVCSCPGGAPDLGADAAMSSGGEEHGCAMATTRPDGLLGLLLLVLLAALRLRSANRPS